MRREADDVDRGKRQLDPLRLDLGDEQQILDERLQPLGAPPDDVEILAAVCAKSLLLVLQHLEEAGNRGERRAELV